MKEVLLGIAVTAIPLLAVGYFLLLRKPAIFRMFVAMVLIGVGYLTATGAMFDIGAIFTDGKKEPVVESTADSPPAAEPEETIPAPAAEPEPTPQPSSEPDEPAKTPEPPATDATTPDEPEPATS